MGLISTADCIDRSREPYSVSMGWVARDLDALIDRSPMLRARCVWTLSWGPGGLQIRVPLTRPIAVAVLEGIDAGGPWPSITVHQVDVDAGDQVVAGVPADGVWIAPHVPGQEHRRRVVAYWLPSSIPTAPWIRPRLLLTISGGRRVALGEIGCWRVDAARLSPRLGDEIDQRDRITYTLTGSPVRGRSAMSRRITAGITPRTSHREAVEMAESWAMQDLALLVPVSAPAGALPADVCQHIGTHGLVGLPSAGSITVDGVGDGKTVAAAQIGLHILTASPIQIIEDAIMALASYALRPHAYRPLAGEYIAGFTGSSLTTQASAAGRYDVWPIVLPIDTTIDQAAFEVTGAATGDAAVVIHASDDLGRPAGLVAQSSPISTGTTGLRTGVISATLRGGLQYWLGLWTQAAPTLRAVSDALPISWAAGAPHTARRVLRRVVTWGGTGPVWSYTASDPAAASPAAVLLRVA